LGKGYGKHEDLGLVQGICKIVQRMLQIDHLTPKSNQHIYEPKYICDQHWMKFPSLVFEILCSQVFQDTQTHALTHRQTDRSEYKMHPTPFLNSGGGI